MLSKYQLEDDIINQPMTSLREISSLTTEYDDGVRYCTGLVYRALAPAPLLSLRDVLSISASVLNLLNPQSLPPNLSYCWSPELLVH